MIRVAYWCPFISEVATVNSVLNSAISLKKFSNNKYKPIILNVFGEWNSKEKILEENNLKKIDIGNKKIIQKLLLNRISVSPMCQYSAKNGFKKKIKQYSRGF